MAVAYNRIESLSRLLGSLEKAYYNQATTLIISVDKSKTDAVERFADEYSWPHGVKMVDKHEKNLGLRAHMMSLGKWFDNYDAIVVLEDDIVVSKNFFNYAQQAVSKYYDNSSIAGISLYSIPFNGNTNIPFMPIKDEHDAFFMNYAISWGEVWMRDSWLQFYNWYLEHQDFAVQAHLPRRVCSWSNKSWLKYHIRYCIEENKFFVHPYVSLTTNYGDVGEHNSVSGDTVYQVSMQQGEKKEFLLPDFGENSVRYDGFFENIALYSILGLSPNELCVDLYGEWHNRLKRRYWLTTEAADYKIVRSYGLNYRPIEANVFMDNKGCQIFLYDTQYVEKNSNDAKSFVIRYHYHIADMVSFVKQYGVNNLFSEFITKIKKKMIG